MMSFAYWPWRHWARLTPHSTALRLDNEDISWRDLARRIEQRAAAWQRAGVTEGSGVALCGKNSPELLLGYLAALQCGARVLPLDPHVLPTLAARMPLLNIGYGWCAGDTSWPETITSLSYADTELEDSRSLSTGGTTPPQAIKPLIAGGTTPPQTVKPSSAAGARPAAHDFPVWQVNRLATLTLTSGSSGAPKAAAHTFAAHLASAAGVNNVLDFQHRHSWLLSLPLYHVSGQGIVWRWLAAGATLVLAQRHTLEQALDRCTHASLVPTQLWRLLQGENAARSVQDVLLGGAMIPADLTQRAEALGVRCWCGYGLTEFASTVCAKRANGAPGVGTALLGREARIVDGEVWLRGGGMAAGYWQQGRLTPIADSEGWFHTRDGGRFIDGELHITGRLDNLFFCGGEGVQPEDIERILSGHPAVRQSFVVPVADEEFGQRPVVVVDSDVPVNELRAWLEPRLTPWQRPIAYLSLAEMMPEGSTTGGIKIARRRLIQQVQAHLTPNT